jgi:hypothetical protein
MDYLFCEAALGAADAEDNCEEAGGELVSIKSLQLEQWLSMRLTEFELGEVLVGADDRALDGYWYWPDDTLLYYETLGTPAWPAYNNWALGYPSDIDGPGCMTLVDGQWRDHACDAAEFPYICEVE